ncbi:hypothetical protein OCC_02722 [Thermococcus litoralis DSM 5473]|uniref:Uncharacterized protein n=1 Tax=Thermococcus litoralis (strain ATCC 51850 / DSM 5473 / JCM 8560 / NS-C) TaxID=523849 RepID=H3ZQN7_THELN|nr:hypothetical protein [Thermococcus litoralis]EHR77744.1 hypothetical protein OCC_02722 [Thermococcus litoralis DSM 5473]
MKIVELDIKLPYEKRGKILSKILSEVRGKIKDIHFLPPTSKGISEIRMEVAEENVQKLLEDIKKIVRDGKISFKVLSEA